MIIDIVFCIALVMAIFKGFSKGLIIAAFSFIAFILGIAAALKFSATVATWLGDNTGVTKMFLPAIAFILVLVVVALAIRFLAFLIKKTMQMALLGWADKLGGIILFALIYMLVFSVLLYFGEETALIKKETLEHSVTYPYIKPIGPWFIKTLGQILPLFKNVFEQLNGFFENNNT